MSKRQHAADARLNAAAPDLLEALQEIAHEIATTDCYVWVALDEAMKRAQAAIAKAIGAGA